MAYKRFGNILNNTSEKWKNKLTDSIKNDVADLRNEEFKKQQAENRQKVDNQMAWDNYKRQGGKIDFPEFDAKVEDLPKEDENEKEIKIDRTPPKVAATSIRPPNTQIYDLDALAGNGIPVKEQPEPVGPSDTTVVEDTDDTVVGEPMLDEPNSEEEPDFKEKYPDSPFGTEEQAEGFKEMMKKEHPKMSDDMIDRLSKGDVSDLPDTPRGEGTDDTFVEETEFDESEVVEPEDDETSVSEAEVGNNSTQYLSDDEGNNISPESTENTEGEENEEEEPEEEPKEEKPVQTANGNGPINDDTDLVKKGSGVSINDIVDRSQIPHYDYLSFFR